MHHETPMRFEPCSDLDCVVGAIVVHDQVKRSVAGKLAVEAAQKLQELLMAVTLVKVADYFSLQQIERGEQSGGSVPFVVMRHRAAPSLLERQSWPSAIKA